MTWFEQSLKILNRTWLLRIPYEILTDPKTQRFSEPRVTKHAILLAMLYITVNIGLSQRKDIDPDKFVFLLAVWLTAAGVEGVRNTYEKLRNKAIENNTDGEVKDTVSTA